MSLKISSAFGASGDFFGHQDYYAARALGVSDRDILAHLDKNPQLLRGRNQKGGGNLYDQISANAVPDNPSMPQPQDPQLNLDPRVGDLTNQLAISNTKLENLTKAYERDAAAYQENLGFLRKDIDTYVDQISGYQDQIGRLDQRLIDQAKKAKQFKKMDTQYLTGNTASGIRLRRSRKARLGLNALGTGSLNRRNRQPLKISNVNL